MIDKQSKVCIFYVLENAVDAERLLKDLTDGPLLDIVSVTVDESQLLDDFYPDSVVVIISNNSIKDPLFNDTLMDIYELKIRLIPVIVDSSLDYASIPESINSIQWVELWDEAYRAERIQRMKRAFSTDFEHLESFRKYERLANDWFTNSERPDRLLQGQALKDAELWLTRAASQFPRPTEIISKFILAGSAQAAVIQKRNERIFRLFWGALGVGTVVCLIFAGLIFRDTLRIEEAQKEAARRKNQSQELIEYMVGELDDKLTETGRTDLLEGIIDQAEVFLQNMEDDQLDAEDVAFKARLEILVAEAESHSKVEDSPGVTPIHR